MEPWNRLMDLAKALELVAEGASVEWDRQELTVPEGCTEIHVGLWDHGDGGRDGHICNECGDGADQGSARGARLARARLHHIAGQLCRSAGLGLALRAR